MESFRPSEAMMKSNQACPAVFHWIKETALYCRAFQFFIMSSVIKILMIVIILANIH